MKRITLAAWVAVFLVAPRTTSPAHATSLAETSVALGAQNAMAATGSLNASGVRDTVRRNLPPTRNASWESGGNAASGGRSDGNGWSRGGKWPAAGTKRGNNTNSAWAQAASWSSTPGRRR